MNIITTTIFFVNTTQNDVVEAENKYNYINNINYFSYQCNYRTTQSTLTRFEEAS